MANCKLKNIHAKLSINDCVQRQPNAIASLLDVLLWWQTNLFVLMLDLERAYQALHTGTMEKFTRLFLWRNSPDKKWQIYGYNRVTFGDMCAATALELTKRRAASLGEDIHPPTAHQLRDKVYVDDGTLAGDSKEELLLMRGVKDDEGNYNGYIARILKTCGMSAKFIAIAGESGVDEEKLGHTFLGLGYSCPADEISFSFPPSYHARISANKRDKHFLKLRPPSFKRG